MQFKMRVFVAASLCLILTGAGCGSGDTGPAKYKVTGLVTLDEKPIPEGVITLYPTEQGLDADAGPIKDGKFSFTAKPGPKRVEIMASRVMEKQVIPGKVESEQYLPDIYNTKTTLKAEIDAADDNALDFDLKSK